MEPGEVTQILTRLAGGDPEAEAELYAVVYKELHRLAGRHLRGERKDHTLQPTALVHEAYLRLVQQDKARWSDRRYFFGVASKVMRRVLINHARDRKAKKRGSGRPDLPLDQVLIQTEERCLDVIALDEALDELADRDARRAKVVELRVFGGLAVEEAAALLGVSARTIKEDWRLAKAWLYRRLTAA